MQEKEAADKRKLAVIYYFRIRIDQIQWLLLEDEAVQEEVRECKGFSVKIPFEIPEDGRASYRGRYRTWLGIGRAMSHCGKESGYISKVKEVFRKANVTTESPKNLAAAVATLFNKLSGGAKSIDITGTNFSNETEVIEALTKWDISDTDQINVARGVYRLNL